MTLHILKILTMKILFILFLFLYSLYVAYSECNSTEENNENKYLIFASIDKNKKALENSTELWDEIKDKIEKKNNRWETN